MTIGLFHGAKAKRGRCDRGVIVTFILLLTAGLIVLYAASYYNAQDKGSPLSEVLSQLMGIGLGAAGMAVVLRIDYRMFTKASVQQYLTLREYRTADSGCNPRNRAVRQWLKALAQAGAGQLPALGDRQVRLHLVPCAHTQPGKAGRDALLERPCTGVRQCRRCSSR